jgi:tol-pal system protein YbgF
MVASLLVAGLVAPAFAQDSPPAGPKPAAKARGGDSVAARLGRLEEKVRDLQVMIGTMESMVRTRPGAVLSQEAPAPIPQVPSAQSDLGPRIDALETQITALTSHLEQIGRQMSALEARLSAAPAPLAPPLPVPEPPLSQQGQAPPPDRGWAPAAPPPDDSETSDPSRPRWFGPKPGSDELATLLDNQAGSESSQDRPRDLTAALPGDSAQTLYQQGYGALLQKDYVSAEGAFRHLLQTYPNDPLAADAQYWIGETFYVRGQYKNAADAFLNGYKKYKSGQKAPDSLLKLGMSLAELGQKNAACSTFGELKTKFPQAPQHVSEEAAAWRKKTDC